MLVGPLGESQAQLKSRSDYVTGPSVEECFKSEFKKWCRDIQIIGMKE